MRLIMLALIVSGLTLGGIVIWGLLKFSEKQGSFGKDL